jgi:hypothetical protein
VGAPLSTKPNPAFAGYTVDELERGWGICADQGICAGSAAPQHQSHPGPAPDQAPSAPPPSADRAAPPWPWRRAEGEQPKREVLPPRLTDRSAVGSFRGSGQRVEIGLHDGRQPLADLIACGLVGRLELVSQAAVAGDHV